MSGFDMRDKIAKGAGFIAALDQSGGSTPKALKGYGVEEGAWSSEEEMYGLIHQMRSRIITAPCFTGDKVIGAILFERTMDGQVDGKTTPQALIDRGVVPFIKIDKGLEDEANGVQMMKPMPELDALLARARGLGVFGTKERSVINSANREGIAAIVAQQIAVGQQVLAAGLVPMLEPEINIKSETLAPREARPFRRAGRSSARAARRRAVGRFQASGSLRRTGQESRHHRQLQPRVAGGPASSDERCGVQCIAGLGH